MIEYTTLGNLIAPAKVIRCGKGSFPVLSMTMHDGIVLQSERFKKSLASIDQSDYKVVKRGQLVVGFPIDEGVLYVQKAADEGIMSPAYNVWDIDTEKVDPDFLELCLHSPQSMQYYKDKLRGTTARRRSIPTADLLALKIRLPDMQTQRETVAIMRKAEAVIAARQEQLNSFEQLVKSRFIELFGDPVLNQHGWQKAALEANATLLNGRAYKQDELLDSGKYPVLRVGNFFSNRGWYYSDLELDDDKYCDTGDLLYAWSASFGPQIWNGGKVIYHYHIWKVLVGEAYNKQFLCKLLEYATESLMGDTHGIAMMHLTKSGMEKTEFIVPPIELQEQFAAFVEQTDKSKLAVQQGLQELEILKKSLMQQYFG